MVGEIAFGGGGAFGAHGGEAAGVIGDHQRLALRMRPTARLRDRLADRAAFDDAQEHPAPLAPPLDQPGLDEDADVARHARLALPQHGGEFADRQFHLAQQRDDPQPGRVRQSAEDVEQISHGGRI